jgi:hypothetical protein
MPQGKTKLKRLNKPANRRPKTTAIQPGGRKGRSRGMKPHEQQRLLSAFLFALALILLVALTFFSSTPGLAQLADGMIFLVGWSAYPLTIGLLSFSVIHFAESLRRRRLMRYTLILYSVLFWQLLLIEAQLLLTGGSFVVIGPIGEVTAWLTWQAHPLIAWLPLAAHAVLLLALLGLSGVLFHLRPRHIFKLIGLLCVVLWSVLLLLWSRRIALRTVPDLFSFRWQQLRARMEQEDERVVEGTAFTRQDEEGEGERATTFEDDLVGNEHKVVIAPADTIFNAPTSHLVDDGQHERSAASARGQALWQPAPTSMLNHPEEVRVQLAGPDPAALARTIQEALNSFRVVADVRPEDISIGPTVIRFGIRPGEREGIRTRVSRIMALQNDLALVLQAKSIRMEAPAPGRPYVGVEIPNTESRLVTLREVVESKEYQSAKAKSKLAMALGRDVTGAIRVGDLARMPHLLIAGATGAGKCLAHDEPVFLSDGRVVKVQELLGQIAQVIGVTNTQTMQQTPVLATFTDNGVQDIFEIELDNGVVLRRTGEHPVWAATLNENQQVGHQPDGKAARRTRAIQPGWVQTKNLRVCGSRPAFDGHVILCPLVLHQQGMVSHSDADVILCAALIAEGSLKQCTYNNPPRFTSADPLMVELVDRAAKEYDCQLVLSQNKGKGPIDYYISKISRQRGRGSGNPIRQLVVEWGINRGASQKTIPEWVFQLPDEQIALFLRVFIDCDGWISAREHETSSVNVSLANPVLIQQIGQLALRLGITGTYTFRDNGHAGAWRWTSYMVDAWQERVGSVTKAAKLASAVSAQAENRGSATTEWTAWRRARPTSKQTFADCPPGYEWRKVVSIRHTTAPTVNIEVHSENHAFIGYAVEHNSVEINAIVASILTQATPDDVKLLMVDPKRVELGVYNGIPHLLAPVVIEPEKVVTLLKKAITEMEKRYRLFSQLGVRNLEGYRKLRAKQVALGDTSLATLPSIVIIIDELADLMMTAPEEVEGHICRLAQLARATGIHLVIATQRPSVDVITGLIKANIPTRIAFMVSSAVDSRTIIDMGGAERLLGRGDMLYLPADAGKPERIQGAFVADEEVERLVAYWKQQAETAQPEKDSSAESTGEAGWVVGEVAAEEGEPGPDDELLAQAQQVVMEYERASISLLQRRLRIGYSRAARLIDLLEERGIIGRAEVGGRAREVLEKGAATVGRNGDGEHGSDTL